MLRLRRHLAITMRVVGVATMGPMAVAATAPMEVHRRQHMERHHQDMEHHRATLLRATRATRHHLDTACPHQVTPLDAMLARIMAAATATKMADVETGAAATHAGSAKRAKATMLVVAVVAKRRARVKVAESAKEKAKEMMLAWMGMMMAGPSQTSTLQMCCEMLRKVVRTKRPAASCR